MPFAKFRFGNKRIIFGASSTVVWGRINVRRRFNVSERCACRVLKRHRSTHRYFPKCRYDEERLVQDMIERARQYGCYVYRRVAAMLIDAGWQLADKQVERLWRRKGLKVPMRQPMSCLLYTSPSPRDS